jgi:ketosteroid isomerase-like protein
MDDTYRINVAKTEFRDGYNCGNVDQLLSVFQEEGFTDMSEDGPSHSGKAAREALRERSSELFAEYSVKLTMIVIAIVVLGNTAYDYGWHEFTLNPKNGEETIRRRHRYFELWNKNSSGAGGFLSSSTMLLRTHHLRSGSGSCNLHCNLRNAVRSIANGFINVFHRELL